MAIRPARPDDRPALAAIYDHYVRTTAVTFDVEPRDAAAWDAWIAAHGPAGPHRLLVHDDGEVRGYASSSALRPKAAYASSVELSVYLAPDARGRRLGSTLLEALLHALSAERVHRAYAGIALPNPASERLVTSAGFERVGLFREVGWKHGRYWDVAWYERPVSGAAG